MSILKFGFTALGKSREEVIEELDSHEREIMARMTGEPWITTVDEYKKLLVGMDLANPDSFIYMGMREVVFAGPTALKDSPGYRDGFRPQDAPDDPFNF